MSRVLAISVILLFPLLLTKCECWYDYTYTLDNQSSYTITVEIGFENRIGNENIESGESMEIRHTNHGVEKCQGPYEGNIDRDFQSFKITTNDTLVSTKNYRLDESWNWNDGNYSAVVTDIEFR